MVALKKVEYEEEAALLGGKPKTLFDKIWADHAVVEEGDTATMYIDRHLVHEVTSPQAFEGLRMAGRKVRRTDCTLATVDHNVPTSSRKTYKDVKSFIKENDSRTQVMTLEQNVEEFGLTYFGMTDTRQGIVHVIGPEQGFTLPGTTVVCGDSHTATHGAFGALAFGIGTSEVEHVMATQTLIQKRAKNMKICVTGSLCEGVTSKDVILHICGVIGTAGGTGHVIEFCGDVFENLSIEARMSVCNMAIEAGARAGMVAPDEKTFEYFKGRPMSPKGAEWDKAVQYWKTLRTDPGAKFDKEVNIRGVDIAPTVTWGTSPQDVVAITGVVPDPKDCPDPARAAAMQKALEYIGLEPGTRMEDVKIHKVFVGSCTNSRIEDLRAVAELSKGRHVAEGVLAMIVPGSGVVKTQAEEEGLDKIFLEAGYQWREPGCSMCLAMNPDKLEPEERCASTSNRNFEGRQGKGGRTHLVSPAMAAAAALTGKLTDCRTLSKQKMVENGVKKTDPKTLAKGGTVETSAEPATAATKNASSDQAAAATAAPAPAAAGNQKFTRLENVVAAPLRIENCDTDQIIPAQFLKTIKRSGLGVSAFFKHRYDDSGAELPEFSLNQEPYRKAQVLVCGDNFGCGSSREHAPWAIGDMGIRCLIAPSFADIFFNNCFKNGMLPIVLPLPKVNELMAAAEAKKRVTVDLLAQTVVAEGGEVINFDVDSFRKHCLVNALDDIGLTLQKEEHIARFEESRSERFPWLDGPQYGGKQVEVRVTASRAPGYYVAIARGFLTGLAATEDRPARPPAKRLVITGTGGAVSRAAQVAADLESDGNASIVKVRTELLPPPSGGIAKVPFLSVALEATRRAVAIQPIAKVAAKSGCCGGVDPKKAADAF